MDCLRSGRVLVALDDAADVLEGRSGGAAGAEPKKSSPSRESAGLVALGGVGSAFGAGFDMGGPVLGRAGVETASSPNKSTTGA